MRASPHESRAQCLSNETTFDSQPQFGNGNENGLGLGKANAQGMNLDLGSPCPEPGQAIPCRLPVSAGVGV